MRRRITLTRPSNFQNINSDDRIQRQRREKSLEEQNQVKVYKTYPRKISKSKIPLQKSLQKAQKKEGNQTPFKEYSRQHQEVFEHNFVEKTHKIQRSSSNQSSSYQQTTSKNIIIQSSQQNYRQNQDQDIYQNIQHRTKIQREYRHQARIDNNSQQLSYSSSQSYSYSKTSTQIQLNSLSFPYRNIAESKLAQIQRKQTFEFDNKYFEYKQNLFNQYKKLKKIKYEQQQKLIEQRNKRQAVMQILEQMEDKIDKLDARILSLIPNSKD